MLDGRLAPSWKHHHVPPPTASHFASTLLAVRQEYRADSDPSACALDSVIPEADHGALLAACMHAQKAYDHGEYDEAWRLLMEAYGAAKYAEGRANGRCESLYGTMSKNGAMGGNAAAKNRRLRMELLAARVVALHSQGETWESASAFEATLQQIGQGCDISMTPKNISRALKMPQIAAIAAAIEDD